jgi:ribosomal protein L30E
MNLTEDEQEGLRHYPNLADAMVYAYEIGYFREHGTLPEDAYILERIEVYGDSWLIIHNGAKQGAQ